MREQELALFGLFTTIVFFLAIYLMLRAKSRFREAQDTLREAQDLHNKLDEHKEKNLKILESKSRDIANQNDFLTRTYESLQKGHIQGRKWLLNMICEARLSRDEGVAKYLEDKERPAYSAAQAVRKVKEDKQKILRELLFLRSKIETYEEYFPFLKELEEEILNDDEDFRGYSVDDMKKTDPVRRLLSYDEYSKLSTCQRNQLALDRYLNKTSKVEIGKMYERFLGWEFEKEGYEVKYTGLLCGFEDRGRDLILTQKGNKIIKVVQAKCWSHSKNIHEKHIFQLFGATYELQKKDPEHQYEAVFVTTTNLGEYAEYIAGLLHVQVIHKELSKDWPMIKCNIGASGNKIYHLPFDQQYDKTKIDKPTECRVRTVHEAESLGFRRAYRWRH